MKMPNNPHLTDTNMLLRLQRPADPLNALALSALDALADAGEPVYITAQNLIEYWNVATRPEDRNGFGLSPGEAAIEIQRIKSLFLFAPDHPDVFEEWQRIVIRYGVSGVQVHDARLVAVMHVYGLTHILTFNTADFARYSDRITVVHPQALISSP
jgi:predicted nucleic acid-binding protein